MTIRAKQKMLIAGALAGLACGVKYTAIPMVFLPLGVAALVIAIVMRRFKISWKPIALYFAVGAVVASPWLIRNLIWDGQPGFPACDEATGAGAFR